MKKKVGNIPVVEGGNPLNDASQVVDSALSKFKAGQKIKINGQVIGVVDSFSEELSEDKQTVKVIGTVSLNPEYVERIFKPHTVDFSCTQFTLEQRDEV